MPFTYIKHYSGQSESEWCKLLQTCDRNQNVKQSLPISVKHFSVTFLNRGTLRNCNKKHNTLKTQKTSDIILQDESLIKHQYHTIQLRKEGGEALLKFLYCDTSPSYFTMDLRSGHCPGQSNEHNTSVVTTVPVDIMYIFCISHFIARIICNNYAFFPAITMHWCFSTFGFI